MKNTILQACLLVAALAPLTAQRQAVAGSRIGTFAERKTLNGSSLPVQPIRIVIDKSDYELSVYDAQGWYATYPVVFGNSSLADKCVEGDRCTPEGEFRIANKRVHEKWCRYMGLDYPTPASIARFNELKRQGKIPKNATPGAGVGIHGTWPHDEYMIDRFSNWTNGCIAMKNEEVQELYSFVPVGTPVTIKR